MGSTIGINTMLLLASVFFILMDTKRQESSNRQIHFGYYLLNLSLLVFFVSLIGAGIARSRIIFEQGTSSGISFWGALHPYMVALGISGTGIFIGLLLIVAPLLCPCRDKLDSQVLS